MCEGGQKLISKNISKNGAFQLRSAVLDTPLEGFLRSLSVELVVTLLNVPILKHTPCCSVWDAVELLCLTEIDAGHSIDLSKTEVLDSKPYQTSEQVLSLASVQQLIY